MCLGSTGTRLSSYSGAEPYNKFINQLISSYIFLSQVIYKITMVCVIFIILISVFCCCRFFSFSFQLYICRHHLDFNYSCCSFILQFLFFFQFCLFSPIVCQYILCLLLFVIKSFLFFNHLISTFTHTHATVQMLKFNITQQHQQKEKTTYYSFINMFIAKKKCLFRIDELMNL